MTIFDLISSLPQWLQVIAYVLLSVWAFEMFLLPFKFNIRNARLGELIELEKKVLVVIEQKNKELNETYVLLSQIMGSMFRREQEEARRKKDVE